MSTALSPGGRRPATPGGGRAGRAGRDGPTGLAGPDGPDGRGGRGGRGLRPRVDRIRRAGLPYLFLVPALAMELLIHIVPMAVGIVISFKELTQFFIRDWSGAP